MPDKRFFLDIANASGRNKRRKQNAGLTPSVIPATQPRTGLSVRSGIRSGGIDVGQGNHSRNALSLAYRRVLARYRRAFHASLRSAPRGSRS